jgi:hypothetical protein
MFAAAGHEPPVAFGPLGRRDSRDYGGRQEGVHEMNNIFYLIGVVVVVVAILGYFGLR